ncbi:hypothetical protein PG984_005197 [Apiospora sp. TS-2023a]
MNMSTSSTETPNPQPAGNSAAEESHVATETPKTQADDSLQVGIPKVPATAEVRREKEESIDCPDDVLHPGGLMVQPGSNLHYEAHGYMTLSKTTPQQRRKQAVLRLAQSKAYAELIEERIMLLEKSVAGLQSKDGKTLAVTEDENEIAPKTHAEINVMEWGEFRATFMFGPINRGHRPEWDSTRRSVIEILRDEPSLSKISISSDNEPNTHSRITRQGTHPVTFEPHQIRLRSKLLLQILNEITGCNTTLGQWKHKLLFLRPFKLLVYFQDKLKDRLCSLERLHSTDYVHDGSEHCKVNNQSSHEISHEVTHRPAGPVKETESVEARDQLKLLCETVDTYLQPQTLLHGPLSAESPKVEFHELWYIFRPGCEVRTRDPCQIQVYRVLSVTGGRPCPVIWKPRLTDRDPDPKAVAARKLKDQGYSPGSFFIECLYIHFDGLRYGPVNATFQIRKFEGKKEITSLPIFPLACDENEQNIRNRLLKRGQEFATLANSKAAAHRKYKGLTLGKTQELVDSEIIVDFQLAFMRLKGSKPRISIDDLLLDDSSEYQSISRDGPQTMPFKDAKSCWDHGCCGNDIVHPDYDVDEKARKSFRDSNRKLLESFDSPEQLTPDHKILLPPYVFGFVLRTRKWATFDIDLISPPEYGTGWDQLVIDKETKSTVLALVDNHERPRDSPGADFDGVLSAVDLVQGKGKGLIILLHGEPGVGKTSTAECVAAHTKRPLFPITCGDIGHLAEEVEANLEQNFQLAHKWGCVLLLDEADIFLSTRTNDDIQRNAIVSVFLRSLEYYSGILFLTTNRVGKIDTAFKSRIHLSLYYKRLDKESTLQIWENNLKRVKDEFAKEKKEIICEEKEIMKFASNHYKKLKRSETLRVWNGRQIRNSFQTAIAIATYESRRTTNSLEQGSHDGTGRHAESLRLSVAHFEKVAKCARQFDNYLIDLNLGQTESNLAHEHSIRYDEFEDPASDKDRPGRGLSKKSHRKRKTGKPSKRSESSDESSGDEDSSSSSSDSDASQHKKKKSKK